MVETDPGIRIFVSYRRADTPTISAKIYGELAQHFGQEDRVFRDINSIERGKPWPKAINRALGSCHVFLVLIGSEWLDATDENGHRRLDDPGDRHRREIEVALEREIPLFPVLINDAQMPAREDLPETLRSVEEIQASRITELALEYDIEQLIRDIEKAGRTEVELRAQDEERRLAAEAKERTKDTTAPVTTPPVTTAPVTTPTPPVPAVRGDFAVAEDIAGPSGTSRGDNAGARKEPDEPDHAGNAGGRSVWYRWTAPEDGTATIDTVGSDFDTVLAVYRGSALAALELVAANDDSVGRQSRVKFPVREGDEYRIAVDGFGGEAGAIALNWDVHPAPSNDDFNAAEEIAGTTGTVESDTTGAGKDPDEPNHAGNPGGSSIWYRWTAPEDGTVTFDTFGSPIDTLLAVYRGSAVAELELVEANDDAVGRQSRVRFPVRQGDEYRIAVDGYGGEAGAIVLNWAIHQTLPLTATLEEAGLRFRSAGEGTLVVPFSADRADQVLINAKEVGNEVTLFFAELPQFTGFGKKAFYRILLQVSYGVDYVKAVALSAPQGRFAVAVEVPAAALNPRVCEGLIKGLVALGDVANQGDLIGAGWKQRLETLERMQDLYIEVDPDRAREEVHAMFEGAGFSSPVPGRYELDLGLERRTVSVRATRRVISLMVILPGVKPKGGKDALVRLLELNRQADVAKVGLDSDGDLILLYEVPQAVPDLVERATSEFASLYMGVRELVG